MLNKLITAGVSESQDPSSQMRIKLLNRMVLTFILGVFIKLLNEVWVNDPVGIFITTSLISLFASVIFLNKMGLYGLAKFSFLTINTLFFMVINMLYGRAFGAEFIFFPLIMVAVLYFEDTRSKVFWIFIFLLSYLCSSFYLDRYGAIYLENLDPLSFYFMIAITTLVVFLLSTVFINENREFKNRTDELLVELRAKNEDLEAANNELEKFAFIASHDLKTPLRNINSFLYLIDRKIKQGNISEVPEYLEYASLNAKRMHDLVQDILEFSRLNTTEVSLQNQDLNIIVKRAIDNLQDLITTRGAVIHYNQLPKLLCNESQLVLLFQNLIENGIKYNESNKPEIDIRYSDKLLEHEVCISDNGIGIEKDYLEKVFEMFYRLHNQEQYSGTGIGLATCKKIATYHGGQLNVKRSSKLGTVFCLKLIKHSQNILPVAKRNVQILETA